MRPSPGVQVDVEAFQVLAADFGFKFEPSAGGVPVGEIVGDQVADTLVGPGSVLSIQLFGGRLKVD
jgi:hypothetical protein